MIATNDGGLGPAVTHSFPRAQEQRGRGTIKGSNHYQDNNPPKEWTRPPLARTLTGPTGQSVLTQGFTQLAWPSKGATHSQGSIQIDPPEVKWTPTPSHQADGAVACRPRSTGWHVRVTNSTNQPARECDVTMSFHGSRTKTSTDADTQSPPSTNLGPSRVHAPSYRLGIGDPIPLPTCRVSA